VSLPPSDLWLGVALGGALGAVLRAGTYYGVELAWPSAAGGRWAGLGPARATLIANVVGTLLLVAGLIWAPTPAPIWRPFFEGFWAAGLCGGLTTFSTLNADAIRLARGGDRRAMILYLLAMASLGLATASLIVWAPGP